MRPFSGLRSRFQSLRRGTTLSDEGSFLKLEDREKLPSHIAFIMDGNGRWAAKRGLPRSAGHKAGTETIRMILEAALKLGVKYVTFYAFSIENWTRPEEEVSGLMNLFVDSLKREIDELHRQGVVIKVCGRINELPRNVADEFNRAVELTKANNGITMILALNYGGRAEIVDAARSAINGGIASADLDEESFREHLYLPEVPDPELIVRTSGELRISNFLLWQSAYSEFYATDTLWPDFSKADLYQALAAFQKRKRRFGGV